MGDDSFRELFQELYPRVRRFFLRKGIDADLATDLTQETFLGIHRRWQHYRERGRREAFVFTAALNVYRKCLRSRHAAKRQGLELRLADAGDAQHDVGVVLREEGRQEHAMIEREQRTALRDAIRDLPVQQRLCLTHRHNELSYGEIAVLMRLEVNTVKSHIARARKALHARLEPTPEASTPSPTDDGKAPRS